MQQLLLVISEEISRNRMKHTFRETPFITASFNHISGARVALSNIVFQGTATECVSQGHING